MLYEMVEDVLVSLAAKWDALGGNLERFAALQFPDDPTAPVFLAITGDAVAKPPNGGLAARCRNLKADIENEGAGVRNWTPVAQLVAHFNTFFQSQEVIRAGLESEFVGLFPIPPGTVEFDLCKDFFQQLREYIEGLIETLEGVASKEENRVNIGRIRGTVEDIASYPLLTSEMPIGPSYAPGGGDGGGGVATAPLRRQVDAALRGVLGRLPRAADTRSFTAALTQSFDVTQVEGATVVRWNPRTYAGQTELGGGVTGAQASLYTRASVALDKALPLLDGLYPLLPSADAELTSAARAIVRSELTAVVKELGTEGGPRVARVNGLFTSLLTQKINENGAIVRPFGHLGYLQAKFGLQKEFVNTLEEEANFSNFLILQDYVQSIKDSWDGFNRNFRNRDLGTNLVLLSRALSVTAETVDEVHAAMDSVFVGPSERQVAGFPDGSGNTVLVDELLSWVVTFASEEAPALAYDGGKRGIAAIIPTAEQLDVLVQRLIAAIPSELTTLPDGLRHPRVLHPLRELRGYLLRIRQVAAAIIN